MDSPLFSIIIATKGRAEKLKQCLESINPEDMVKTGSELILVDNGSTDNSHDIIREYQVSASFRVKSLFEQEPGLSFCRNKGLQNAQGQIIIFTDDDCYLSDDYLKAAQKIFQKDSIGFATGRVLLHDPTDCPIMTCTDETLRVIDIKSLAGVPKIIGANMVIRKSVIRAVGGFDPWFGSGAAFAGDDIDYISRVLMKGYAGVYDPCLVVFHHHGRKDPEVIANQERFYARGVGALYCKRILKKDAGALNALLFALSSANHFSLFTLSQEAYKEEMLQGALTYLRRVIQGRKSETASAKKG